MEGSSINRKDKQSILIEFTEKMQKGRQFDQWKRHQRLAVNFNNSERQFELVFNNCAFV